MIANVDCDKLKTLSFAVKNWIPRTKNGRPVHVATAWRWCKKGLLLPDGSRLRMEAVCAGRNLVTSRDAVDKFLSRLTEARLNVVDGPENEPTGRTPEKERELQAAGLA